SSRRRHTRWPRDWSSDVCSSDLYRVVAATDERELSAADAAFTRTLGLSLGVLALALVAAVAIQVRVGLRPLHRLSTGVAAIREEIGRASCRERGWQWAARCRFES